MRTCTAVACLALALLLCACLTPAPTKPTVPTAPSLTDEVDQVMKHLKDRGVCEHPNDYWMTGPGLAESEHTAVMHSGKCVGFLAFTKEHARRYLVAVFEREEDADRAEHHRKFLTDGDEEDPEYALIRYRAFRKGRIVLVAPRAWTELIKAFNAY